MPMDRNLIAPRWLAGALVVLALADTANTAEEPPVALVRAAPAESAQAAPAAEATVKLNLNTVTPEELRMIHGVGDRMVREFLECRPYTSLLQFRREIGKYVSAEQVAAYEQYVFVPVDPNTTDAETLQQLPGVDVGIAAQLIAGRPYDSADAFLARLAELMPADQAAAARAYLTTP